MFQWIKKAAAGLFAAAILLSANVCYANDPFTKLGRGAANVLTGWIEVPKGIQAESAETNGLSGATVGLAEGLGMGIVRTVAGAYEIISFPFPAPADYQPVLEPEYVF